MDAHQNFALAWDRLFNLPDLQDIGQTVSVAYQSLHHLTVRSADAATMAAAIAIR